MATKVLLSIKPEYAFKIFEGTKKYEFRKSIFREKNIKKIIVYASYPVKKVIGEFEIEHILYSDIEELWQETQQYSGISKAFFKQYFIEKEKGYAIKIKSTKKYQNALSLKNDFQINFAPQSFQYLY